MEFGERVLWKHHFWEDHGNAECEVVLWVVGGSEGEEKQVDHRRPGHEDAGVREDCLSNVSLGNFRIGGDGAMESGTR